MSAASVRDFYIAQVHADPAKVDGFTTPLISDRRMRPPRASDARGARVPETHVSRVHRTADRAEGSRFLFDALAPHPRWLISTCC